MYTLLSILTASSLALAALAAPSGQDVTKRDILDDLDTIFDFNVTVNNNGGVVTSAMPVVCIQGCTPSLSLIGYVCGSLHLLFPLCRSFPSLFLLATLPQFHSFPSPLIQDRLSPVFPLLPFPPPPERIQSPPFHALLFFPYSCIPESIELTIQKPMSRPKQHNRLRKPLRR